MGNLFKELTGLSAPTLAAIGALAGACGAIGAAIVTALMSKLIVTPFLSARDRQDKEAEWRKHAIELTKLAVDIKLKTQTSDGNPIRPPILDFLANYRDLQELGTKSPKELYLKIRKDRISQPPEKPLSAPPPASGAGAPLVSPLAVVAGLLLVALLGSRISSSRVSSGDNTSGA